MSNTENIIFSKAQLNELLRVFGNSLTTDEVGNLLLHNNLDKLKERVAQQRVIDFIRERTPR